MMKKMKKTVLMVSLMFAINVAHASDLTDILDALEKIYGAQDLTNMALDLTNDKLDGISGFEDLISQYSVKQFDQEILEWKALTKAYGLSNPTEHSFSFEDASQNPDAKYTEFYSPDEWDEALKSASGGNNNRYQELKNAYAQNNPTLLTHPEALNATEMKAMTDTSYTQKAQVANTALAQSQYNYDEVNQRIKNLEDLLKKIDDNDPDTGSNPNEKSAVDLNSRLLVEIGLMEAQMFRLQTIQAQAQSVQLQDTVNHETLEKQLLGVKVTPPAP